MKYFTLKELTKSSTAKQFNISNDPNETITQNLINLVNYILDPLREAWGSPIYVTSGYRSPELNKKVKGAKTSQHMLGQAADIKAGDKMTNKKLFQLIQSLKLPYDQLIDEYDYSWIHVSYSPRNRRQILHIK